MRRETLLDSGEDVGRIRPLPTTDFDQPIRAKYRQHGLKEEVFRLTRNQSGTEFTQNGAVKTRIGQVQGQGIFPINATAHRISRLRIG